jgi:phage tail protein X
MIISNDIATALYERLTADGYSASAHVIPAAVETMLPHIHVTRTGGPTSDRVIEENNVAFDVYAETQADADSVASYLCGWVRALEGTTVDTPCYKSEIVSTPYPNPDPRHPNIGRATFKAQIAVRVKEV